MTCSYCETRVKDDEESVRLPNGQIMHRDCYDGDTGWQHRTTVAATNLGLER